MSRQPRRAQNEEPPGDWLPTQAVDDPIVSSPYLEPHQHWLYQNGIPALVTGRRKASYWFKTKKTGEAQGELFAEQEREDLTLVNHLREDVDRWRKSDYRGASSVTKELLKWWKRDDAPRRLFFCQREAVDTLIYLLEIALPGRLAATQFKSFKVDPEDYDKLLRGERPGFAGIAESETQFPRLIDPPNDPEQIPLRRLGCKMATGSGKTVVMAKIVTWAFANRGRNPSSRHHPHAVLICAPNLTVRERLQVLRPDHPQNYYDQFDLVPPKYRDAVNGGKVLVTNWHALALKNEHSEGGTSYKVVNKGPETPDAFTINRLGDLAERLPILVLNDEGHHCWRPAPPSKSVSDSTKDLTKEEKKALEEEAEEARIWLAGLDRINNCGLVGQGKPGIVAAIDLSATPFYLSNSGYPEGSPFPWLVSDFGLIDAIESGIVKIPRLPVLDDQHKKDEVGRPNPKYFRLWRNVTDNLKPSERLTNKRPKPDAVYRHAEGALTTLASQWKERFEQIREKSPDADVVPPVMIVVCDNTEIAQVFFEKISGETVVEQEDENGKKSKVTHYGNGLMEELTNSEGERRTIRIDSALLDKLEAGDGQTRDQAAQQLRAIIGTVGQPGKPGGKVRCVVSVGMLTEGWDATNVTHILGIRAFGSQLLCEQVVGRGLRRMSYKPDPDTGMLTPEYVDVYGIPFSLIPFKGRPKDKPTDDPVYHHVYALPEKSQFEIRVPVVESYTYGLSGKGIDCKVEDLEGVILNQEPTEVFLAAPKGYQDDPSAGPAGSFIPQNRDEYYKTVRLQQILFELTKKIVEELGAGARADGDREVQALATARHLVFPDVLRIVQTFVRTKVTLKKGVRIEEIAHEKYQTIIRERIRDGITAKAADQKAPLLPVLNSYKRETSTSEVNFRTSLPVVALAKSHLNYAPFKGTWESQTIDMLENLDFVECFSPNHNGIGFAIPYQYEETEHVYIPDFIVRLRGGTHVMLEIKGGKGEIHGEDLVLAKNTAARKWVTAVTNAKSFGEWVYEICKDLTTLRAALEDHATAAGELVPFRVVEPNAAERFVSCVPLVSLKAAAGGFSEEQSGFEERPEWASDWVTWDDHPRFEPGMFVARVQGRSMEPDIPSGSYCLFRPPRGGTRQGKKMLVRHAGIADPETGGQYTLKIYKSEKIAAEDGGWEHTRIILEPLNDDFDPVILEPEDEGEVTVLAEFVALCGVDCNTRRE